MAEKTFKTIYRDTETGRFAKKSTWRRSISQGGTRYRRQRVHIRRRIELPPPPPKPPPTMPLKEWLVTWTYKRSAIDFYVVAATESRAARLVLEAVASGFDSTGFDLHKLVTLIPHAVPVVAEFIHEPDEEITKPTPRTEWVEYNK